MVLKLNVAELSENYTKTKDIHRSIYIDSLGEIKNWHGYCIRVYRISIILFSLHFILSILAFGLQLMLSLCQLSRSCFALEVKICTHTMTSMVKVLSIFRCYIFIFSILLLIRHLWSPKVFHLTTKYKCLYS